MTVSESPDRLLRILYHHRTQGRGAESVHIGSVVRALRALGHHVTVLGPPGVDTMSTEGQPPVDKSAVSTRGLSSLWKWFSRRLPEAVFELVEIAYNAPAWWRLRAVLSADDFDVVYERYAFYLIVGALMARSRSIPFVLEANEVSGLHERARPQSFPRLCARFEKMLLRRCTAVVTVTSYLAGRVREAVPDCSVIVVPNAVGRDRLEAPLRRADLIARYGLANRCVVAFAGWFDDWDRLDMLVRTIAALKPEHPEVAGLLIGDGPQADALREQIHDLGLDDDIVLTGAVPRAEVYDHMVLADIAALPHASVFQSPMVMFEFMACRCALVAPRVAGIEDVMDDGTTGLTFDRGDEAALVAAVRRLVEDPELRARMADAAHARLQTHHLWEHNARAILDAARTGG